MWPANIMWCMIMFQWAEQMFRWFHVQKAVFNSGESPLWPWPDTPEVLFVSLLLWIRLGCHGDVTAGSYSLTVVWKERCSESVYWWAETLFTWSGVRRPWRTNHSSTETDLWAAQGQMFHMFFKWLIDYWKSSGEQTWRHLEPNHNRLTVTFDLLMIKRSDCNGTSFWSSGVSSDLEHLGDGVKSTTNEMHSNPLRSRHGFRLILKRFCQSLTWDEKYFYWFPHFWKSLFIYLFIY